MSKRAMKRQLREGTFDAGQFEGDDKIRRLPVDRGWSPMAHHNDDRDQAYLKTIKAKSAGQEQLIKAIDEKNLVLALGPAGTGKTYLAIAKAVEALESGRVGRIVIDPSNSDVVFVAAQGHSYGPQRDRGIYRTTAVEPVKRVAVRRADLSAYLSEVLNFQFARGPAVDRDWTRAAGRDAT